jgi:hypothetical protein
MALLLVDGIYPKWAIFVSTVSVPVSSEEKFFATKQEAARKDIERAFGTLVQQFQILQRPIRFWYWEEIVDLVDCCIILHNMIVEHRRFDYAVGSYADRGGTFYAATDQHGGGDAPGSVSLFQHMDGNGLDLFEAGELLSV